MSDEPFHIDVGRLRMRDKDRGSQAMERVDQAGEALGFASREPTRRRGRRPSPRTGQVHAKVLPHVSAEIAEEARRRGVQQGVVLEEAWALYKKQSGL